MIRLVWYNREQNDGTRAHCVDDMAAQAWAWWPSRVRDRRHSATRALTRDAAVQRVTDADVPAGVQSQGPYRSFDLQPARGQPIILI